MKTQEELTMYILPPFFGWWAIFRSLAVMLLVLVPAMSWAETVSREFDAVGIKSLSVNNMSGEITVSVTTTGKALVDASKVRFPEGCKLVMERSGGKLSVETSQRRWSGNSCRVHLDIKVPAVVSLDIKNGSGDIEVEGTNGPIEFKLGSGDVMVQAMVTDLNGSSGSGNISVSGLTGNANLKLGSGDIRLEYSSLPTQGNIKIKNGSGDSTIILPKGSVILTNLSTGSGRIYNEIGDAAGAPFKVNITTGSGKLSIKKAR